MEYRLIRPGKDLIRNKSDDLHWVLQFPKGLALHFMDEDRSEQQKKDNPDYPYNLNMSFALGMPGFRIENDPKDKLEVFVSWPSEEYGTGRFDEKIDSFSARVDNWANYKCRRAVEVGPGVFALRQPTEGEIAVMAETYGTDRHYGKSRYSFPVECDISGRVERGAEIFAV